MIWILTEQKVKKVMISMTKYKIKVETLFFNYFIALKAKYKPRYKSCNIVIIKHQNLRWFSWSNCISRKRKKRGNKIWVVNRIFALRTETAETKLWSLNWNKKRHFWLSTYSSRISKHCVTFYQLLMHLKGIIGTINLIM